MRADHLDTVHTFLNKKYVVDQHITILILFLKPWRAILRIFNNDARTLENTSLEQQRRILPLKHGRTLRDTIFLRHTLNFRSTRTIRRLIQIILALS